MQRDKSKIEAAPFRLSWPAIIGGMFAAASVWLLLHAFGLAVGLSQLQPSDPSDLRATGIGSGIWTVVVSMASLFVGGMVTTRAAGLLGRSNAGLHGIVLWGVTTVGGLILIGSVVSTLARGVSGVSYGAISISQRVAPDVTRQAAEEAAAAVEAQMQQQQQAGPTQRAAQEQERAETLEQATTVSARVFWAAFAVMLLSLLSSVLGAIAGVTRRQRELSAQVAQLPPSPVITSRPVDVY